MLSVDFRPWRRASPGVIRPRRGRKAPGIFAWIITFEKIDAEAALDRKRRGRPKAVLAARGGEMRIVEIRLLAHGEADSLFGDHLIDIASGEGFGNGVHQPGGHCSGGGEYTFHASHTPGRAELHGGRDSRRHRDESRVVRHDRISAVAVCIGMGGHMLIERALDQKHETPRHRSDRHGLPEKTWLAA